MSAEREREAESRESEWVSENENKIELRRTARGMLGCSFNAQNSLVHPDEEFPLLAIEEQKNKNVYNMHILYLQVLPANVYYSHTQNKRT